MYLTNKRKGLMDYLKMEHCKSQHFVVCQNLHKVRAFVFLYKCVLCNMSFLFDWANTVKEKGFWKDATQLKTIRTPHQVCFLQFWGLCCLHQFHYIFIFFLSVPCNQPLVFTFTVIHEAKHLCLPIPWQLPLMPLLLFLVQ